MLNLLNYRKILNLYFIVLPILVCIFVPTIAFATDNLNNWSWTKTSPNVFSSVTISSMNDTSCDRIYEKKHIVGEFEQKNVCMMPGDKIKFGTYYQGNQTVRVVGFGYDDKMYKVWGACDSYGGCAYLEATDTLVAKQYQVGWYGKTIMVFKNFTKRLRHTINGASLGYNFDNSNPDFVFSLSNGEMLPLGGFGVSDDGNWVATEIIGRGIGVLDIKNLKLKIISNQKFYYGGGFNPTTEVAVSNNGQHVAIVGLNSGFTIYDISNDCGDDSSDEILSRASNTNNSCISAHPDASLFIDRFFMASSPRFNIDGGQLSFYALSYAGEVKDVSLRAGGYSGQKIDYLALGDSFSSGEGEIDDAYYQNSTNFEFEKCHVSTRSYPYLVADISKIKTNFTKNISCSGATTGDITSESALYNGQGGRLGKNKLNLDDTRVSIAKNESRQYFIPGRIPQIDFVKEYTPKIITIGIGGNDAGFMDKLKACMGKDTCSWAIDDQDREQSALEIKNLHGKLVKTFKKIHDASKYSKIFAVGYPKIIDQDGKCSLLLEKLLNKKERKFINEGVLYLNQIIKSAASNAGIGYVDIYDSYGDHVLCGKNNEPAMNFISYGDDFAISQNMDWLKVLGQETFHPNPLGHSLAANSIGDIVDLEYCFGHAVICPSETAAPEPSSYWIPDTVHDYPTQKVANFVYDIQQSTNGLNKNISIDDYYLKPNSKVAIEITSEARYLGGFVSNEDGALNVDINLPDDLERGYHTVRLYGTSYSGEEIELYQVIEYKMPTQGKDVAQNTTNDDKRITENNVINSDKLEDDDSAISSFFQKEILGDYSTTDKSDSQFVNNNPKKLNDNYIYVSIILATLTLLLLIGFYIHKKLRNNKIGSVR